MSSKDLTYRVGVDASDATAGLRKLESSVRQTMRTVDDELEDGATAGEKLSASLDKVASQMREDFASAAIAAERMGQALKEAGSELDVGDVLPTLQRMGLSMDEITQEADKLAVSLKQLDDVRATGAAELDALAPGLAAKLDDVSKSADSSKGALANMVGNTAQDLGELGGIAGSAGVAVGQMAEYFADAAFEGEGLRSVIKSFAGVAGPIAGLALAVQLFANVQKQASGGAERTAESVERLSEAFASGDDDVEDYSESLRDTGKVSLDVARSQSLLQNVAAGINDTFRGLVPQWRLFADVLGASSEELEDITPLLNRAGINLEQWSQWVTEGTGNNEEWRAALARTTLSADEQAKVLETLSQQQSDASEAKTNATQFEQFFGTATEESTMSVEEQREAIAAQVEALKEQRIALADASRELAAISSVFDEMGRRSDALSALFELGNAPADAASATRDIAESIQGLAEAAADVDVGAILAGNMDADAVLDSLDGLRPQIQAKVAEAFAAGGPEAAQSVAADYVNQIVYALGGKLTADQVAELLGLADLEATVAVALDMSTAERVRSQLAVLTGVSGETPLTASIALALDAGTISPEAAEVLVRAQLGQAKVTLPTDVTPPTPEDVAEAGAFVTEFAKSSPGTIPSTLDPKGAAADAEGFARSDLAPATIPLEGDATPAETAADDFVDEERETSIGIDADTAKAAAVVLAFLTQPRVAKIYADLPNIETVNDALNRAARDRTSEITVTVRTIEDSVDRWYRLNAGG